jgi:hypothetical protein
LFLVLDLLDQLGLKITFYRRPGRGDGTNVSQGITTRPRGNSHSYNHESG